MDISNDTYALMLAHRLVQRDVGRGKALGLGYEMRWEVAKIESEMEDDG